MGLEELYDKVVDVINHHYDYHCSYCCDSRSEYWGETYVTFDVHGWNDQGSGCEWTEYWCIYDDGRIYADDVVYANFEEFKNDWD